MSYTASTVIKIALAEVGYLEKETNKNLDSKTGNAGDENYTKYARDLFNAGYYNGNKNGYAWCDCFHDWIHWIAAGKDAKEAQRMICQTGSYGAGCDYSAQYYQNKGRLFKDPKRGDQIFFWNSKKTGIAHTGIVVDYDATYVYTVEGNTSSASGVVANGGAVEKKKYPRSNTRIYRYGRPYYDEETSEETYEVSKEDETVNIELSVLRRGSKGEQVKALQRMLHAMGYNLGKNPCDGDFGEKTETAVRTYQRLHDLTKDGVVGKNTWAKLLKG